MKIFHWRNDEISLKNGECPFKMDDLWIKNAEADEEGDAMRALEARTADSKNGAISDRFPTVFRPFCDRFYFGSVFSTVLMNRDGYPGRLGRDACTGTFQRISFHLFVC